MTGGMACQFISIEIYHNGTGVNLRQKANIMTILRLFSMEHINDVSRQMERNGSFHLATDPGETELEEITVNKAVMASQMYSALTIQPDISHVRGCPLAAIMILDFEYQMHTYLQYAYTLCM
jgi:hypothetical protein